MRRQDEISAEVTEATDRDSRTKGIGRVDSEVVISRADSGFAEPFRVDDVGVADRCGEIIDIGRASTTTSCERTEIRVLPILPGPVAPEEHVVVFAERMIQAGNKLLA